MSNSQPRGTVAHPDHAARTGATLTISRHADIGRIPRWKEKDLLSQRNGPHATVYMINGDWYLGEWKDNMKH
ncbi:hypothetical protein HK104_007312, partial [Borealophlyctis nickersoniae]